MKEPLIVLLTDFGLKDHYVGVMKGVIKGICPQACLIDLTHEIPPQDVREGAYVLGVSYPYFPEDTVFIAVVDPGVGTERKGLVLKAGRYYFVGPDNGLFTWVVKKEKNFEARELKNPNYFRHEVSPTFQGRDIFAPAAAHLACGTPFEDFGPQLKKITLLPWPEIKKGASTLIGEVIHVDRFGNLVTNISTQHLKGKKIKRVLFKDLELPFLKTYGEAPKGAPICLIGSDGFLEIAIVQGSAVKALGREGKVEVEFSLQ